MIVIIKYNAGNITSVQNAVERLGYNCVISDDEQTIRTAAKVIFPGVGNAASAMKYLKDHKLDTLITSLQQPVLGICLGQQLLCKYSEEGNTTCLGVFDSNVKLFPSTEIVPHTGWNSFTETKGSLFEGVQANDNVYFVHSFYCNINNDTIATCNYILPFAAAMKKNNFYATQFHPEKSAAVGEQILKNFLSL